MSTAMPTKVRTAIGYIEYITANNDVFIINISWSNTLTKLYYTKSNFITFTKDTNIPSVHPSMYKVRKEPQFRCDNGFQIVSRPYKGKHVFNLIDTSEGYPKIVCDIDFTQILPFSEYKDMTARGYIPDRRCWMVFDDGKREEVNESRKINKANVIRLTESDLKRIIIETMTEILIESA